MPGTGFLEPSSFHPKQPFDEASANCAEELQNENNQGDLDMSTISTPEYNFRLKDGLLGLQMLFIAFGALVLVPLLTGLDPNVALFTAGGGNTAVSDRHQRQGPGFPGILFRLHSGDHVRRADLGHSGDPFRPGRGRRGLCLLGLFIRWQGPGILERVLPPIVYAPVIMVIGLILAPGGREHGPGQDR
jgi:uracil permease